MARLSVTYVTVVSQRVEVAMKSGFETGH